MLEAWIPLHRARQLANWGPNYMFHELLTLVPETLSRPHAIFPFVADEFRGWCYSRRARMACTGGGRRIPAPAGRVFTVFVSTRMIVADWGWELASAGEPTLPVLQDGLLGDPTWTTT